MKDERVARPSSTTSAGTQTTLMLLESLDERRKWDTFDPPLPADGTNHFGFSINRPSGLQARNLITRDDGSTFLPTCPEHKITKPVQLEFKDAEGDLLLGDVTYLSRQAWARL